MHYEVWDCAEILRNRQIIKSDAVWGICLLHARQRQKHQALSPCQIVFYVLTFLGMLLCYSQQTLTNLPFLYKILQCVRSAARITISKPCFACNDRNRTLLPGWSLVSASLTNGKSLGLLCTLGKRTVGWELSNSDRFGAFFAHQVCGIKLKIKLISMIRVRIASGRISSSLGKKRLWTAS